ncbi:MAG: RloB domain-containing protein [Betaproteobacteria bacterium]|nr:RloB domain-containing protein [Betaproteobacteria bacterium]
MGKDRQPKHRQAARDLRRRVAQRVPADRLLIVCEGEKTEPSYLTEIRHERRLPSANIQVRPTAYGTEPLKVVEYAEVLFRKGNPELRIPPRSFDRVVAVFDRDSHRTYHAALTKAEALNERMVNDENVKVPFEAIVSVPCFELWLLLHFEDVLAPIGRDEVHQRLRQHLPGYAKGQGSLWMGTKSRLDDAIIRAEGLITNGHSAHDGELPFTNVHALVQRLQHLKDQAA